MRKIDCYILSRVLIPLALIIIIALPVDAGSTNNDSFIEIKGKFPSTAESCPVSNAVIDYGGKIQIVLTEGKLYRRRKSVHYDYFFIGSGQVIVVDSSGLCTGRLFDDSEPTRFESAYICGQSFPEGLGLGGVNWRKDKISAAYRKKLQFQPTAADKYLGVNIAGEFEMWPDDVPDQLPVWVDVSLVSGRRLVVYLSPDLPEQLQIYHLNISFDEANIIGAYNLDDRLSIDPVMIDSTDIKVRLKESGKFVAAARLFLKSDGARRGIRLVLPYRAKVDSVLDGAGKQLPFIKKKLRANLYISTPNHKSSLPEEVTVYYRSTFLKGIDYPVNLTTWFPHLPHRVLGLFNIHYTLHKDLTLISVGTKIREVVDGDQKTITYRTSPNISYISFASGMYDVYTESYREIPFKLLVRKDNNIGLFNRHIPRLVMFEIKDAFDYFYEHFGAPVTRSLDIVDQPIFYGQSSPGLIHLSEISFQVRKDQSHFRSHEVAHQWWGHTVVPNSYSDMWLSEGLAEFSASLYLIDRKNDTTAHRDLVNQWRAQIVEQGKVHGYYSRGYLAGPIVMGTRLWQSSSPGDYVALVYSKAAYMLRMLRFELDGPDYSTDYFSIMLSEYRRTYYGQQASSQDFVRIAGKRIGQKRAKQFFDHWLYGWKIPAFDCRYDIITDAENRQSLKIHIRVSGMEEGFETPYPIEVEFADGSRRLFRLDMVGQKDEFFLGPFPLAVSRVRFDPDHIILSKDKKVGKM